MSDLPVIPTGDFVFLGGTVNSQWRERLTPKLRIAAFNPIVTDWTPEHVVHEERAKEAATYLLYAFTPAQTGMYGYFEASVSIATTPGVGHTLIAFFEDPDTPWTPEQKRSIQAVTELYRQHSMYWVFTDMDEVAAHLNRPRINSI